MEFSRTPVKRRSRVVRGIWGLNNTCNKHVVKRTSRGNLKTFLSRGQKPVYPNWWISTDFKVCKGRQRTQKSQAVPRNPGSQSAPGLPKFNARCKAAGVETVWYWRRRGQVDEGTECGAQKEAPAVRSADLWYRRKGC